MSRWNAKRSAQQDRLVQLSDDNAFVNVEAALKRMGEDVSLETSAPQSSTKAQLLPYSTTGKPSGSRGGGSPSAKYRYACRGSRASEDALLNGIRVPLTVCLQEQHKAYLESVSAAATEVKEMSSSSDSDVDDDGASENVAGGVSSGRRTQSKGNLKKQKSALQPWGRATKSVLASSPPSGLPPVSAAERFASVSMRAPKKEDADVTAAVSARKRLRGDVNLTAVKQESADVGLEATGTSPKSSSLDASLSRIEDVEGDLATVSCALVAKLNAQLGLIKQWRRTVLDYPPLVINGILSPEPYAPWAAVPTSNTVQADAKSKNTSSPLSKDKNSIGDPLTKVDTHDVCGAGEAVLPYPLLQLYTLCPSYEALTAAPVQRRHTAHVLCNIDDGGEGDGLSGATLSAPAPHVLMPLSRSAKFASSAERCNLPTETVDVAGVSFSIPLTRRRRNFPEGRSDLVYRLAGFLDFKNGDGVPGAGHHHLCSVCMLPAPYRCARCRVALFCSIECHVMHDATRCLKFTV